MMTRNVVLAVAFTSWSLAAHAADSLDGTWKTACAQSESSTSVVRTAAFAGTNLTLSDTQFSDSACAKAAYSVDMAVAYEVGNQTQIPGAESVDMTVSKITATVVDQRYLDAFNQQKVCGIADWKLNEAQDITGKVCGQDGSAMPSSGSKAYDVLKADQGTDGVEQLVFGSASGSNDGSSADKRPTELDNSSIYKKQ